MAGCAGSCSGITPYGVTLYGVTPYGVTPYGVTHWALPESVNICPAMGMNTQS
jgi:hypothetical protein